MNKGEEGDSNSRARSLLLTFDKLLYGGGSGGAVGGSRQLQQQQPGFGVVGSSPAPAPLVGIMGGEGGPGVAQQYRALLLIPTLFSLTSNSATLNAAFMKMADVFINTTSNLIRHCIFQVVSNPNVIKSHHLITCADEVISRFHSVLLSNDPIARAITLRVFSSMPTLIRNQLLVHHGVRNSLDSNNQLEVDASIATIESLCSCSCIFAESIITRLDAMIKELVTPLQKKLKIIRILRHMHHTAALSQQAEAICREMLKRYPLSVVYLVTLDTLTSLACTSVIIIPKQVDFLFTTLKQDMREEVCVACLKHLECLTKVSPHTRASTNRVEELLGLAEIKHKFKIHDSILQVFQAMCQAQHEAILCNYDRLFNLLDQLTFNRVTPSHIVASTKLVQCLMLRCSDSSEKNQEFLSKMQKWLLGAVCFGISYLFKSEDSSKDTRISVIQLARFLVKQDSTLTPHIIAALVSVIEGSSVIRIEEPSANLLSQCIFLIAALSPSSLSPHINTLCAYLTRTLKSASLPLMRNLCGALLHFSVYDQHQTKHLQQHVSSVAHHQAVEVVQMVLQALVEENRNWECFIMAREAFCIGQHTISTKLFSSLSQKVEREHFYFWFQALSEISSAEVLLTEHTNDGHAASMCYLYQAKTHLMAASDFQYAFAYQIEFVSLRIQYLEAVLSTCAWIDEAYSPHSSQASQAVLNQLENVLTMAAHFFEHFPHKLTAIAQDFCIATHVIKTLLDVAGVGQQQLVTCFPLPHALKESTLPAGVTNLHSTAWTMFHNVENFQKLVTASSNTTDGSASVQATLLLNIWKLVEPSPFPRDFFFVAKRPSP
ncbi:integrator complex subunit 7 [Pelomyxa schiedti]|nr:integrator complex subunit 7 [Pelomyxa schiedti]